MNRNRYLTGTNGLSPWIEGWKEWAADYYAPKKEEPMTINETIEELHNLLNRGLPGSHPVNVLRSAITNLESKEKPMLTWDAAVQAMKDEGYIFRIARGCCGHNDNWAGVDQYGEAAVVSEIQDPTAAINDLLTKCRERWPAKHPWDDLSLVELVAICEAQEGRIHLMSRSTNQCGWDAVVLDAHGKGFSAYECELADALRAAMKAREAAGS